MNNSEFKLYVWELGNPNSWSFGIGIVVAKSKEEAYSLLKYQAEEYDMTLSPTATHNREIVNQVEYECSEGHFKGRIAFKHYYQNLKNDNKLVDIENLSMPELTHYFYNIYNIVKWVDTNYALLKKDNKSYQYIRLIRGVLSQYELYLLFYFGLTKDGKKLEYFINKYTLFKYLPSDFNKSECVGKYINRAFKYKKDDDEWQEYQTMHDQ